MESLSKDICGIFLDVFQHKAPLDVDSSLESMGFDSLKLTVLQYKLSELGYSLDLDDLDLQNSISQIVRSIESKMNEDVNSTKQLPVGGDKIFLSPGQNWFLSSPLDADSWNVVQIFEVTAEDFDFEIFQSALQQVVQRHEMLRSRFIKKDTGDYLVEVLETLPKEEYLVFTTSERLDQIYGDLISRAEARIRCDRAPLFNFSIINNVNDGKKYIIFLMHHLIADVYSISLFFREISSYYQHYAQKKSGAPNLASDDYKSLLNLVKKHVNSAAYVRDLDYWKSPYWKAIPPIPKSSGKTGGENNFGSKRIVSAEFNERDTLVLSLLPKYMKADSLIDVLLFALSQAITKYLGSEFAQVIVVDSGRSYFWKLTGINTSSILGWLALSSLTLVRRIEDSTSLLKAFDEFKPLMESSPDRGFGYSLQYLRDDPSAFSNVHTINDSQKIVFNHLGEVDFDITQRTLGGQFKEIYNSYGLKERDIDDRACCFRIATMIREGKFMLNWEYGNNFHSEDDIAQMSNDMLGILLSLIEMHRDSLEIVK